MNGAELKDTVIRLQEINITLSTLYAERGALQARLFTDPQVGPTLSEGGEVESPDGYGAKGEKIAPEKCSPWEQKNLMKSATGHLIKLKLTLPKVARANG